MHARIRAYTPLREAITKGYDIYSTCVFSIKNNADFVLNNEV